MTKPDTGDAAIMNWLKQLAYACWWLGFGLAIVSVATRWMGHELLGALIMMSMWLPALVFLACIVLLFICRLVLSIKQRNDK